MGMSLFSCFLYRIKDQTGPSFDQETTEYLIRCRRYASKEVSPPKSGSWAYILPDIPNFYFFFYSQVRHMCTALLCIRKIVARMSPECWGRTVVQSNKKKIQLSRECPLRVFSLLENWLDWTMFRPGINQNNKNKKNPDMLVSKYHPQNIGR